MHQQLATKPETGMHSCRETCIHAACMIKLVCVLSRLGKSQWVGDIMEMAVNVAQSHLLGLALAWVS